MVRRKMHTALYVGRPIWNASDNILIIKNRLTTNKRHFTNCAASRACFRYSKRLKLITSALNK